MTKVRSAGALAGYLRTQYDAILANRAGVRAGEPDAIHDMRVAVRRLRSTLRTFRPVLDRDRTEPVRAELKWLGDLLGAVRDRDVLRERLLTAVAAEPAELVVGPVAARIRQNLAADTAEARGRLHAALDGQRVATLLERLDALVGSVPTGLPKRRLRKLVHRSLRRAHARLAEAARRNDPARLHEARKDFKKARYAVEATRPELSGGKRPKRLVKRLRDLQDALGTHHDVVETTGVLRTFGMRAYGNGENAFTYGLLLARQDAAGGRVLTHLPALRRRAVNAGRWIAS